MNKYLECAKAVGTHGVRGMIKLFSLADSPEALAAIKTLYTEEKNGEYKEWKMTGAFVHKGVVVASIDGVDTLDGAIAMKGVTFFADRDSFDLEDGDFFIADAIGLPVFDAEKGEEVGVLSDVMTGRIQPIYVIKDKNGGEVLVPGVPEFIKNVVTEGDGAGVFIRFIDGMLNAKEQGEK